MASLIGSLSSQPQQFSTPSRPRAPKASNNTDRKLTGASTRTLSQSTTSTPRHIGTHHREPTVASMNKAIVVRANETERKQESRNTTEQVSFMSQKLIRSQKKIQTPSRRLLPTTPSVSHTRVTDDKPKAVVQEAIVEDQVAAVEGSISVLSPTTRKKVDVFAALEGSQETLIAFANVKTPEKQGVYKVIVRHFNTPEARQLAKDLGLPSPAPIRERYIPISQSQAENGNG